MLWTALMAIVAIVVAGQAIVSLYDSQQACFFQSGAVPCPAGDDPRVAQITVGFIGVPLAWAVGVAVGTLAWAMKRHLHARRDDSR